MESIISKSCIDNNISPKDELQFRKKLKQIFLESSKETFFELINNEKYKEVIASMFIIMIQKRDEKKSYINSSINVNGVSLPINIEYEHMSRFVQDLSFC